MRLFAVVLLAFAAAPAAATTAVRAELPELVAESDLVVLGTAGPSTSSWEGGRIVTRVPVAVDEVWAGDAGGDTIEVVTLGGIVGDIGQTVHGAPRLHRGDRVVLCLKRHQGGRFRVVEMTQGAFFVVGPPADDPAVRRRSFGMRLVGSTVEAMPLTLRALEHAVREADHARR